MSKNILLIGAINIESSPLGGEEYKNQLLYRHLSKKYTVKAVDTHAWKSNPFIIIRLLTLIFFNRWHKIVLSASSVSVYRLLRVLGYFPFISTRIIYFVIGGYFPTAIEEAKFKLKPYENINSTVVEGELMKAKLIKSGYSGKIFVIPNFKQFQQPPLKSQNNNRLRFLFLSRIHPDKGIQQIIDANKYLQNTGIVDYTVTFYGPLDSSYEGIFESMLPENMAYAGTLDIINKSEEAYRILAGYDVMLFPSYWQGEGFPGTLVDAFVAGLPVIATDWNMNREVIQHGRNGLLIPPQNAIALATAMKTLIQDNTLRKGMAVNSWSCAEAYNIEKIWPNIESLIEAN